MGETFPGFSLHSIQGYELCVGWVERKRNLSAASPCCTADDGFRFPLNPSCKITFYGWIELSGIIAPVKTVPV